LGVSTLVESVFGRLEAQIITKSVSWQDIWQNRRNLCVFCYLRD